MNFKTLLFKGKLLQSRASRQFVEMLSWLLVFLSVVVIALMIYDIGFKVPTSFVRTFSLIYLFTLSLFSIRSLFFLTSGKLTFVGVKSRWLDIAITITLLATTIYNLYLAFHPEIRHTFVEFIVDRIFIYSLLFVYGMSELSGVISRLMSSKFNPSPLFAFSFLLLIGIGSGLLMLPNSTLHPIPFIDALFTATSAVCITGLCSVDIATTFTESGRLIIMLLVQIGGLGVITFTSFLGMMLLGKTSLSHDIMVKDFWSHEVLGEVVKVLRNIILTTFILEAIGAFFIYRSIGGNSTNDLQFAMFHAVSAFCNAGFSTVTDGLYNSALRENYTLHIIIASMVIIGGIGFPILSNFYKYLKHYLENIFHFVVNKRSFRHKPNIMTINSKIALTTTFILLTVGFVFFFISEYNHTMEGKAFLPRIATSFFMTVTPRSSGFNTFDMNLLSNTTILLMMLFMWIGGSPISTGGGVKTTTFAVAVLSLFSTLRGRNHIEVYHREITKETVQRAFAMIVATMLLLFIGTTLVSAFEGDAPLTQIVFECISALSTTGLSLNFTHTLSAGSKLVIIVLMFLGRVGLITILSFMVKRVIHTDYSYPKASVMIG